MEPLMLSSSLRSFNSYLVRVRPAWLASSLKAALGVKRAVLETQHGRFSIDPASYMGDELLSEGIYEPTMIATLERHLRPGSVFIDVGAHEGYFTVIGAKICGP